MNESENPDDIYEGFEGAPPVFNADSIFANTHLQTALKTASRGRRPTVSIQ